MASRKTALVTGGARGIGAAVVAELSSLGFIVDSPSRTELDLANLDAVADYVHSYSDQPPDALVLNAGVNVPREINDLTIELWQQTMDVNVSSAFLLIKNLAPRMAERGGGWITAVSSCYSMRSRRGRAPYSASKAALNSLVRSAALEFAPGRVLVNAVAPGFVMTDLTRENNDAEAIRELELKIPIGRLAEPKEIASLVGFLSGPTNSYVTGQVFVIDGGFLCQ